MSQRSSNGRAASEVSRKNRFLAKKSIRHGSHANAAVHNCHDLLILLDVEDQQGA
ncbi:hypothetical protein LHFGNBLO_004204 [Mesorhizobium sp. AR10]|uniref:hypothetical protein n=1 Tax=Mesorhizobium sp. AR10 TaxID=2865839 RepID=UPI00215EC2EA|nr:hypothetical protein [Mesorhizobium sp. AR10]UVK37203.1 hypothetical protein LHFGNBLO_004204 [Mesorhizobium sp. AR10]